MDTCSCQHIKLRVFVRKFLTKVFSQERAWHLDSSHPNQRAWTITCTAHTSSGLCLRRHRACLGCPQMQRSVIWPTLPRRYSRRISGETRFTYCSDKRSFPRGPLTLRTLTNVLSYTSTDWKLRREPEEASAAANKRNLLASRRMEAVRWVSQRQNPFVKLYYLHSLQDLIYRPSNGRCIRRDALSQRS